MSFLKFAAVGVVGFIVEAFFLLLSRLSFHLTWPE